jgi:hypothetical protein
MRLQVKNSECGGTRPILAVVMPQQRNEEFKKGRGMYGRGISGQSFSIPLPVIPLPFPAKGRTLAPLPPSRRAKAPLRRDGGQGAFIFGLLTGGLRCASPFAKATEDKSTSGYSLATLRVARRQGILLGLELRRTVGSRRRKDRGAWVESDRKKASEKIALNRTIKKPD